MTINLHTRKPDNKSPKRKRCYLNVLRKKLFCDLVGSGESYESAFKLAYDSENLNQGHLFNVLKSPYVQQRLFGN